MLAKYISVVVFSRAIRRKNTADLLNCVTNNKSASQCHALRSSVRTFRFSKRKRRQNDRNIHGHAFLVFRSSVKAEMGHKAIK